MTTGSTVTTLLNKIVRPQGKSVSKNDEKIFETGLIDSYGIVEIVSALEEHFKLKIPMEDLTIQNFATVNDIAKLVERLQLRGP
jgi:D-alanine--poly(phosphoribitol) ligase subunit 2